MRLIVRVDISGIDGIIERYSTTYEALSRVNDLANVHIGSVLLVDTEDDIEHIVMPFETIDKIAKKYHISPEYLKSYNDITSVFVGDRLLIPLSAK